MIIERLKLGLKLAPLASEGLFKSDDVELGEDVLVAGYPYGELFSNTIKVTKGIVSANKGMGDDRGLFQMDAAVQPGNPGVPSMTRMETLSVWSYPNSINSKSQKQSGHFQRM